MNKNKYLAFFLVFLYACSGARNNSTGLALPNIQQVILDRDVYTTVPPVEQFRTDAGLNLRLVSDGEMIAPLNADARAPFAGVLFNQHAVARLQAEFEAQDTRCAINRRADYQNFAARALADLERMEASYVAHDSIARLVIRNRDRNIQELEEDLRRARSPLVPIVVGSAAVITGVAVGGLLGAFLLR